MITNKMTEALNEQVNAELWSAYLYLAMSLDAESKALKGIANWFFVQWLEEQDHARIIEKYLSDQDAKAVLKPVAGVPASWTTPVEMFRAALEHEKKVTRMIGELVKLASVELDFATISRLQWFVDEQVEEESSLRDILSAFDIADCGYVLRNLDEEMAERKYHRASPLTE